MIILPDYFNNVPRETIDKLHLYEATLTKWQKSINLVSNSTIQDVWTRHFLDSAQLTPLITSPESIILDIGSGAGFPSMVLAIMGYSHIHLVESDAKKCTFLREISRICSVKPTIHNKRIESIKPFPCDVIISRACAPLETLISYALPFMTKNTYCLFPKGQNYTKEIDDAKKNWEFTFTLTPSLSDASGNIIKITNITKR